jgi:hypothetical protein
MVDLRLWWWWVREGRIGGYRRGGLIRWHALRCRRKLDGWWYRVDGGCLRIVE